MKGYAASEIIGKHFSIFYTAEDVQRGHPLDELSIAAAEGRYEEEGWRVRKDGSQFWANVVITALYDADRALCGFGKVTRDFTARRRTEQQLRRSEERFRHLVQGVRDYAIFMIDVDGNVASWNDGAQRLTGYEAHEIIGEHFSRFFTAEDLAADKPGHELVLAAAEGRYEVEAWRVRKDGSRFWANVVVTALKDDAGNLYGFAKVTRDFSERKATEEELRRSEQKFRLLVQGVRDYAIFIMDPNGVIASWNEGRSGSRAIPPRRSSASTSRCFIRRKTSHATIRRTNW
jgi:PAS domain S-box-containing protein